MSVSPAAVARIFASPGCQSAFPASVRSSAHSGFAAQSAESVRRHAAASGGTVCASCSRIAFERPLPSGVSSRSGPAEQPGRIGQLDELERDHAKLDLVVQRVAGSRALGRHGGVELRLVVKWLPQDERDFEPEFARVGDDGPADNV